MPRLKISHARRVRKRICKRLRQPAQIDVLTITFSFNIRCSIVCVCAAVSSCGCSCLADTDMQLMAHSSR